MSASIVDSSPLPLHSVSERWQFLATLPETALLEFVRAQSRTTNVNWLDTMVDGGLLRVPDAIKGQLGEKNPNGLREAIDAGLMTSNGLLAACDPATAREVFEVLDARVQAFTAFVKDATMVHINDSPEFGRLPVSQPVLAFPSAPGLGETFERATGEIADALNALKPYATESELETMGMRWASALLALDLPKALVQTVEATPNQMGASIDANEVSKAFDLYSSCPMNYDVQDERLLCIGPLYLSLMTNRPKCVQALMDRFRNENLEEPIACWFKTSPNEDVEPHPLEAFNFLNTTHALFTPDTWLRFLTSIDFEDISPFVGEAFSNGASDVLVKSLSNPSPNTNLVSAFERAGVYAMDPLESLASACKTGNVGLTQRLANGIEWTPDLIGKVFSSNSHLLRKAVSHHASVKTEDDHDLASSFRENATLALQDAVQPFDDQNALGRMFLSDGQRLEPAFSWIDAGWIKPLVHAAQHGMDLNKAHGNRFPSVMEYAQKTNPEIHAALLSQQAHAKTMSILNGIEINSPKLKP